MTTTFYRSALRFGNQNDQFSLLHSFYCGKLTFYAQRFGFLLVLSNWECVELGLTPSFMYKTNIHCTAQLQ